MVWWWGANGQVACTLLAQSIGWEIWEKQGWQSPCNKTPPSPHCTWIVHRHGGRVIEENRGKRADGVQGEGSDWEKEVHSL